MRILNRKSLRWLTPLAIVLAIAMAILPIFVRHAAQRRIAQRIVDLGGSVEVRSAGPGWLFHFASDKCREQFREAESIEPWGPAGLRDGLEAVGMTAFIKASVVADRVDLVINKPGPHFPDSVSSPASDLPQLFEEISNLPELRALSIDCFQDCVIDSRSVPAGIETLIIRSEGPDHLSVDLSVLPPGLRELSVSGSGGRFGDLQLNLSGIASLQNLRSLELKNLELSDQSLEVVKGCTTLNSLSLAGNVISDAGVAHLKHLKSLESLTLTPTTISDAGIDELTRLPILKDGEFGLVTASDAAWDRLRKGRPEIIIRRVSVSTPGPSLDRATSREINQYFGHLNESPRQNGFDR